MLTDGNLDDIERNEQNQVSFIALASCISAKGLQCVDCHFSTLFTSRCPDMGCKVFSRWLFPGVHGASTFADENMFGRADACASVGDLNHRRVSGVTKNRKMSWGKI